MERQELDVRTLWQALRRSWRTLVVCLLVGILGGVALSAVTTKQYQASSSVLLRRAGETGNTPEGDMATEVAIANSVPVASRVQLALGIDEPIEVFLKRYAATAQTDDVLVFLSTAKTPDEAVSVANTLSQEFLAYRQEQDSEDVEVLRRSLAERVAQLEAQVADYDVQIAELEQSTPDAPIATDAEARLAEARQAVVQELGAVRGTIATAELQATIAGEGSKVLEPASPPSAPTAPNVRFNLILGVLAGFAVGIGIVVVRELTSGKLRTRHDIAAAAGAPVVRSMRLPSKRALPTHGSRLAKAWKRPGTSVERGVKGIVADLGLGRTANALLVASVDCDGEAAYAALCVARELVENGRRPMLVDAGHGRPVLQGVLSSIGVLHMSDDDGREPSRWFAPTEYSGKLVWTPVTDGSFKLLGWRARRPPVTSSSSTDADFLIVFSSDWSGSDEPPRLDVPCDTAIPGLLTVVAGRSTGEAIRRHAEAFEGLSAAAAGVVVMQPDRFDETTGQLETPAVPGATPLRSRAVES